MDAYFDDWFGDEAEAFKAQTQDIFAHAVFARTNALAEELEEFEGITLELAREFASWNGSWSSMRRPPQWLRRTGSDFGAMSSTWSMKESRRNIAGSS